ncbi:serine/threonine-protein kinase bri1-like 2 [Phtheirospermum japonicum]|uniref:Serine/threonine-protein kinase bri1-like 2 n=1 Tax=Phtheirospermum japonicum TaxID=374723 RepID=A0A830BEU4_9LAMI|nr:serine/threonine-protein kinase bri1-like 2 [Phtheirospermum japonicum]
MTSLSYLDLSGNRYNSSDPHFVTSKNLAHLILSFNSLNHTTDWISDLMWDNCHLKSLSLWSNRFYGDISGALKNLSRCSSHNLETLDLRNNVLVTYWYGASFSEVVKGVTREYRGMTSTHVASMDLSSNYFVGEIPSELTNLTGLIGLNLSHNHLRGEIPRKVGDMKSLESLDLSSNSLFGTIPEGLSKLTFLSKLNLSNNNLSGQIPTGPQLQTLNDTSNYEGNPGLCGAPLLKKCQSDEPPSKAENDAEDDDGDITDKFYFFVFIFSGFVTGLCGYFGVLVFKTSWRLALFRYMDAAIGKMMGRQ